MTRWMMAAAASVALVSGAGAQGGLPPTRSDIAPAAPTQNAPPDGGKRYEYPPNTGAILRPQDRTPYDVSPTSPQSKSSTSEPASGTNDPSRQSPQQVGR